MKNRMVFFLLHNPNSSEEMSRKNNQTSSVGDVITGGLPSIGPVESSGLVTQVGRCDVIIRTR